jgi:hypothetical protein
MHESTTTLLVLGRELDCFAHHREVRGNADLNSFVIYFMTL